MKLTKNINTGDEELVFRTISTSPKEHFEGRWKSGRLYPLYSVVVNNGTTFVSQNAKMKEEPYVIYDAVKQEFKANDGWKIKEMSADSRLTALGGGSAGGGVTPEDVAEMISGKQDTIEDLSTIRSGASAGATAYQKPNSGIPASDIASGVIPTDVVKYSLQTLTDAQKAEARANIEAQDYLVSGTNIKTVNGESILGSGNIAAGDPNAVKYTEQTLTDAQKTQSRTNIGAGTYSKPSGGIPASDIASGVIPTVPTVSTDVSADAASDVKTSSPKSVKTYVDAGIAAVESDLSDLADEVEAIDIGAYDVAWDGNSEPVVANIPAGVSVTYNTTTYTGTLAASASTIQKIYLVATGTTDNYDRYVTVGDSTYSWVNIGTTEITLADYATKTKVSQLEAKVAQLDSIPINVSGLPTVDHAYVTSAGKWAGVTGRNGSFIPVTPGDKVVIVAGQLECRYSYLTEIPTSASGGGTPPFVSGTGVNFLEAGGIVMVTIPSGSACLQINRLYGEDDYSPSYVTIVGGRFDKMDADILDNAGEIFNHSVYKNISGITDITHHYVDYSTGGLVASDGWDAYRIRPFVGSKIRAKVGINLATWASIAFYNSDVPKSSTYISGVQGIAGSNIYEATVPAGTVLAIICNRRATDASPSISVYVDNLIPLANELSANSATLYELTGNVEKRQSAFGRAVSRSAGTAYSDMTWVGDKLVAFNSSDDDLVSDPAKIVVYSFANGFDKPNTGGVTVYHTFGHCNTVDYCTENDCLILGNGSGDYELAGQIFIIPNFSAIVQDIIDGVYENTTLTLSNTDAVVIDCEDYDLGTKFNVIWGEDNGRQYDVAYLITAKFGASTGDGGDNGTIRRILLGRGSNELQYGQILSGKSASEFNGTFAICDTYTQPNTKYSDGCNQGTCFHKGKIISAVNHDGLNIWSMRLTDGKIYRSIYSQKTFDPDGTETKHNISGICVKDGRMYIGGVDLGILCYDSIVE